MGGSLHDTRMRPLKVLLQGASLEPSEPVPDVEVGGVALDSRRVRPGDLFVALAGDNVDGHDFIPDALERGAVAVVGTREIAELPRPYVQVPDGRRALAGLSAAFFGHPGRTLTVLGVTGTDGKTTTLNLIYQILSAAGLRAGMITTVNAVIGDRVMDTGYHVTTPEAPDIQRYLAEMTGAGLTHVLLEVTSHGLAQRRVDGCEFDVGVVTNVTHEHLDYHGDYEGYRAAKGRLFELLSETGSKPHDPPRGAVINRDDQSYSYLANLARVPQVTFGRDPEADVRAEGVQATARGLRFQAAGPGFRIPIETGLVGGYNVANCLAAIAATAVVLGVGPRAVRAGITALAGVPGRMETIDLGQDFTAIVDFAHTPNALREALRAARGLTDGRVIAVFGSAGLRDREKRRLMAEVSGDLADLTVLTAEDPRTESLAAILAEMAAGVESRGGVEGKTYWRIPDRGEALRFAVGIARPGDLVMACGKGHEQSMCFGTREYPWDDRVAMRAALAEHLGVPGPEMPYLPTQDAGSGETAD